MIDRRELLRRAREKRLTLAIIEKDYVIGWVLYTIKDLKELTLKGGTALAKIYFPDIWRLSEDLDLVVEPENFEKAPVLLRDALLALPEHSGIGITIKSEYTNPGYLQLKAQYSGPLGKNWVKLDVTPEPPIGSIQKKNLPKTYTDYPKFQVSVESLEEIFSEKLRSVVQRTKVRDYYDLWRMNQLTIDHDRINHILPEKMKKVNLDPISPEQIFFIDLEEQLQPYWEKELGRLVNPTPNLHTVLAELRANLNWIE